MKLKSHFLTNSESLIRTNSKHLLLLFKKDQIKNQENLIMRKVDSNTLMTHYDRPAEINVSIIEDAWSLWVCHQKEGIISNQKAQQSTIHHPSTYLSSINSPKTELSMKTQKTSSEQMVIRQSLGHKTGHNLIKLIEHKPLIGRSAPIDEHSLYHLINLRLRNTVMYRSCHSFELHVRDEVIAVGVVARKDLLDALSRLEIPYLRDDPIYEDIKGDRLLDFHHAVHELEYEGVHIVRSQLIQGGQDLNRVNHSGAILIEDVEGVDQFLVILREEARAPVYGAWRRRVLVGEVLIGALAHARLFMDFNLTTETNSSQYNFIPWNQCGRGKWSCLTGARERGSIFMFPEKNQSKMMRFMVAGYQNKALKLRI